jgi:uncharacterized membrane protein
MKQNGAVKFPKTNRAQAKRQAKRTLKRHYLLFVAVCLAVSFLGAENASSLDILTQKRDLRFADSSVSSGVAYVGEQIGDAVAQEIAGDVVGQSQAGAQSGGISRALSYISDNDVDAGEKEAAENVKRSQEKSKDSKIMQRRKGVLAKLINDVSSGTIVLTVYKTAESVSGSPSFARSFMIIAAALLLGALWFFIENTATVISRRIFLEGRTYEKVPLQRFVFLFQVKKQCKASWTMFVLSVFKTLWNATVIGGIVKKYSYYLVPYIVAENPDIGALEAITLSRKMMKGHKWECFVWELSFIPWTALSFFTFGLLDIFFLNPYKICTFGEFYAALRAQAKADGLPLAERLNDAYLFERADVNVIKKVYADVIEIASKPEPEPAISSKGLRFLSDWFGILILSSDKQREYERAKAEKICAAELKAAAERKAYPDRLFPIGVRKKRKSADTLVYSQSYTVTSLIMMFFCFSFIGWLWEVSLHLIEDGIFVNRGMLHGPWLPIYGSGGVLVFVLLKKLRDKPLCEFCAIVALCGAVEYLTSYFTERAHGMRWWNYSGYFLNLNGRICAEGLLVFGLAGMAGVYFLAPLFDSLFSKINRKALSVICAVIAVIFIADAAISVKNPNSGKGISSGKPTAAVSVIETDMKI